MSHVEAASVPLVVDLDGTLIRGDLLHESALRLVSLEPWRLFQLPFWLGQGKARMKRRIAEHVDLDLDTIPVHDELLAWVRSERSAGRRIVLCSASDDKYVQGMALRLGGIDEVIASDGVTNISARRKAAALESRYGLKGFDYVGNSRDDLHVWRSARRGIVVNASERLHRAARAAVDIEREFSIGVRHLRLWLKAMRLQQWAKNLLVFLPLLASHRYDDLAALGSTLLAFFAFGFCASSTYLVNDLSDLESDRVHPRKRHRPFAAGTLSAGKGAAASAALAVAAFLLASLVNLQFMAWLGVYLGITLYYTFVLKRKVLVDALALAALYTIRIWPGCRRGHVARVLVARAVAVLFLSLAFVKRYSELGFVKAKGLEGARGRDYLTSDLPLIESFGIASGFAAVVVLALYMNGDTIVRLYPTRRWCG
jgi:4-hydroxybenzoate polyprenyltransferase/phosphoserine phosphatase